MYELNDSMFFLVDTKSIVILVGIIVILIAAYVLFKVRKVNN